MLRTKPRALQYLSLISWPGQARGGQRLNQVLSKFICASGFITFFMNGRLNMKSKCQSDSFTELHQRNPINLSGSPLDSLAVVMIWNICLPSAWMHKQNIGRRGSIPTMTSYGNSSS